MSGGVSYVCVRCLAGLLDSCNLSSYLSKALTHCDERGIDSVAMLREDEEETDLLIELLRLKPAKAKQVRRFVHGWTDAAAEGQGAGTASGKRQRASE